jgi:hypothetical protein
LSQRQYYSDELEVRRPQAGLLRGALPERVRFAVANFVETVREVMSYQESAAMWSWIVRDLNWSPSLVSGGHSEVRDHGTFKSAVQQYDWTDTLDLFSAIFYFLQQSEIRWDNRYPKSALFRSMLNEAFVRHYSAYLMDEQGRIVEPGAQVTEEAVAEARAILSDPTLSGPDRQFQDALLDFTRQPSPNYEGAVSNAMNAVEGMARVALGSHSALLPNALRTIARERNLHGALADSILKLYAYASDAGGRHGLVGDPKVDRSIAEFCLHQAAAAIVLFARLYGYEVAEGNSAHPEPTK